MMLAAAPPLVMMPWMRQSGRTCWRSMADRVEHLRCSASRALTPSHGSAEAWEALPCELEGPAHDPEAGPGAGWCGRSRGSSWRSPRPRRRPPLMSFDSCRRRPPRPACRSPGFGPSGSCVLAQRPGPRRPRAGGGDDVVACTRARCPAARRTRTGSRWSGPRPVSMVARNAVSTPPRPRFDLEALAGAGSRSASRRPALPGRPAPDDRGSGGSRASSSSAMPSTACVTESLRGAHAVPPVGCEDWQRRTGQEPSTGVEAGHALRATGRRTGRGAADRRVGRAGGAHAAESPGSKHRTEQAPAAPGRTSRTPGAQAAMRMRAQSEDRGRHGRRGAPAYSEFSVGRSVRSGRDAFGAAGR